MKLNNIELNLNTKYPTSKNQKNEKIRFSSNFNTHYDIFQSNKEPQKEKQLPDKKFQSLTRIFRKREINNNIALLTNIKNEKGKNLFKDKKAIKQIATANKNLVNYAIKLAQITDEKGHRLINDENIIAKIIQEGEESCKTIINILNATNKNGQRLFSSPLAISNIIDSEKEVRENALKLVTTTDENGEHLFQNQWTINNLSRCKKSNCENLITLAKLKDKNGNRIFSSEKKLQEIIFENENASLAALEIANAKDENNENLFTNEESIIKLSQLSSKFRQEAINLALLKDKDNKRLFTNINAIALIAVLNSEARENAINLSILRDENNEKLFTNEMVIFNIAKSGKDTINKACKIAALKNESNEKIFKNEILIFKLAQSSDTVIENAIKLAELKDENGQKVFNDEHNIVYLAKESKSIRDIAIYLTFLKDENGNKLFDNTLDINSTAMILNESRKNNPHILKDFIALYMLKFNNKRIFDTSFSIYLAEKHREFNFEKMQKSINENGETIDTIIKSDLKNEAKRELILRTLNLNDNNYTYSTLKQKMDMVEVLTEIQKNKNINETIKKQFNIDKDLENYKNSIEHAISTTKTNENEIVEMFKNFFANNDEEIEKTIKNTDFTIYEKQGLPLTYPREKFLSDLDEILSKIDEKSKTNLLKKLQIQELRNKNNSLIGYNGIINLDFITENENEEKALKLAKNFILNNRISTNNERLNKTLNSLIIGMPEFINIIGKKQHSTQDYSIDIHILTVLNQIINNPEYNKLSDIEKTAIKLATIMHDIAKPQEINDKTHPYLSALYAKDILDKYNLPIELKNRIIELIKNHHWLELYNTEQKDENYIASVFRRKNDIKIARIMTEADLKAINKSQSFYNHFKNALNTNTQKPIDEKLDLINSTGLIFLTSKIVNKALIPTLKIGDKEYKIIDFTKLPKDFDLSKYGFSPNTTPENLRLFAHYVDDGSLQNIETLIKLNNPIYEGCICASYISLENNRAFSYNTFGASIEAENTNISNAYSKNQDSGINKNFENFSLQTNEQNTYRKFISDCIKQSLKLTDEEYRILFTKIQNIKYSSQLDNLTAIKAGSKKISSKELKKAIQDANNQMFNNNGAILNNNEANLYTPKVNALIAKVNTVEELPPKLLKIAENYDLPIYILGNNETSII